MNPLDQLREIHTPPAPALWPPAPGWWLLMALALVALMAALWLGRRYRRRNRYRRQALQDLRALLAQPPGNPVAGMLTLVRRTALTANPETTWAALSAPELLVRLDPFTGGELERNQHLEVLAEAPYRPESTPADSQATAALGRAVARWIRKHREADLC